MIGERKLGQPDAIPQEYVDEAARYVRLPANDPLVEGLARERYENHRLRQLIDNQEAELESVRSKMLAAESELAELRIRVGEAMIDRRSGLLRNDTFEDIAAIELSQLKGFDEKRRDIPNQAIMIFGDLVDFREFNNAHGHVAGDKVINNIGELLNNFTRPGSKDIAGRIGEGDEFSMIVFFRADNSEESDQIYQTINERLYEMVYEATEGGFISGFKWRSAVYEVGETYNELRARVDPKHKAIITPVYEYPVVRKKFK